MKAFSDALAAVAAQRWMLLALAALTAFALLFAFVNTLQDGLRHGAQLRQSQHVSSVRQTISTAADAVEEFEPPKLR